MKKILNYIFVGLVIFSFGLIDIKAASPFVGTCYCIDYQNVATRRLDCSDYKRDSDAKLSEFPEGVCEQICLDSGFKWYGSLGASGVDVMSNNNTTVEKWSQSNSKDCAQNTTTNNVNCKYNYSKTACASIANGSWNNSTNCCDLKAVCWLHVESGMGSEGGTLYWSETSPCGIQSNIDKYPDQKCSIKNISQSQCVTEEGKKSYGGHVDDTELENKQNNSENPDLNINDTPMTCDQLLGPNLTSVVHLIVTIVQVAGAIICIVNAMLSLLPAVISKDADALKKASSKCITMGIILALIFILPALIKIIGKIFEFDISCLI